jgi:hypothetical protein
MNKITIACIIFGIIALILLIIIITGAAVGSPSEPMNIAYFNELVNRQKGKVSYITGKIIPGTSATFKSPKLAELVSQYQELLNTPYNIAVPSSQPGPTDNSEIYFNNITAIVDNPKIATISGYRVGGVGQMGIADFRAKRENDKLSVSFSWGLYIPVVHIIISSNTTPPRHFALEVELIPFDTPQIDIFGGKLSVKDGILTFVIALTSEETNVPELNVTVIPSTRLTHNLARINECGDGKCVTNFYNVKIGK